jgi:hypothetical protein
VAYGLSPYDEVLEGLMSVAPRGVRGKRIAGLLAPVLVGGGILAVHAVAFSGTPDLAAAASCGATTTTSGLPTLPTLAAVKQPGPLATDTTTSGATTTTASGSTTTASGSTTTTAASTTTTACNPCPTATTSGSTTTTASGTTTTGSGTTTTGGSTTTTSGSTTTTAASTTTTACTTTTTAKSTTTTKASTVHLLKVDSDHHAGDVVVISGSAPPGATVAVRGSDPVNGTRQLGAVVAGSDGSWSLDVAHGFVYNTVIEATSGGDNSNLYTLGIRQEFGGIHIHYNGHDSHGYHYTITGGSTSHIPGERLTVTTGGVVVGRGTLASNGSFSIRITIKTGGSHTVTLSGTGNGSRSTDPQYALPGSTSFTARP